MNLQLKNLSDDSNLNQIAPYAISAFSLMINSEFIQYLINEDKMTEIEETHFEDDEFYAQSDSLEYLYLDFMLSKQVSFANLQSSEIESFGHAQMMLLSFLDLSKEFEKAELDRWHLLSEYLEGGQ